MYIEIDIIYTKAAASLHVHSCGANDNLNVQSVLLSKSFHFSAISSTSHNFVKRLDKLLSSSVLYPNALSMVLKNPRLWSHTRSVNVEGSWYDVIKKSADFKNAPIGDQYYMQYMFYYFAIRYATLPPAIKVTSQIHHKIAIFYYMALSDTPWVSYN